MIICSHARASIKRHTGVRSLRRQVVSPHAFARRSKRTSDCKDGLPSLHLHVQRLGCRQSSSYLGRPERAFSQ
eukprot:5003181-Amphidinium_carterae.1